MKIGIVLGTRPEIIKNYSIVKALKRLGLDHEILHTNQHDSVLMRQAHFDLAGYQPTQTLKGLYSIGKAIDWVCESILKLGITHIIVNGDTAASLIGATAALYTDSQLVHVEAGLRSFDIHMIEERNRIMVDAVSHYLFTYTEYQANYLRNNSEIRGLVMNIGNTTVDLIHDFERQLKRPRKCRRYAFVTLHRKEFTDHPERMENTFIAVNKLISYFDEIVFPMHPRTKACMMDYQIPEKLLSNVTVIEPISFIDSLSYEKYASLILTDSGCIQEEAYIFGVPCVTVRENSERHETVINGANIICGFERLDILTAVGSQLEKDLSHLPLVYGPPGAGQRAVDILLQEATIGSNDWYPAI